LNHAGSCIVLCKQSVNRGTFSQIPLMVNFAQLGGGFRRFLRWHSSRGPLAVYDWGAWTLTASILWFPFLPNMGR
jgi:hypothetical protein